MYCRHTTEDHDAWRIEQDARNAKRFGGKRPNPGQSEPTEQQKKLTLSEKLRTALCTQAGFSADLANKLLADAEREDPSKD